MKIIALFRHLPTDDDINGVFTSVNSTVPLAPIRLQTLRKIRKEMINFIDDFQVSRIYCSNNPRGLETARNIFPAIHSKYEILHDSRLNNLSQPEWAKKRVSQVKKTSLYKKWRTNPKSIKFQNGESLSDVKNRVESLLQEIGDQPTILISHTITMQVILCCLLNVDVSKIWNWRFEHLRFTVIKDNTLLRYNSDDISNIDINAIL